MKKGSMGRNAGEDEDRAMRAEPGHGALAFLRKTVIPYKGIFAHGKRLGKGRPHRNRRARRRPAGLSPLFLVRIGCFMTPQRSGQYRNFADYKRQRARMARQLEERGISDEAVLAAMRAVQRHLFVPEALQSRAYEDHPLPIGFGQTISQPAVVAFMTQVLETRPDMRVLEIGTGSGYQTAVLAAMGLRVFTVERVEELHAAARELFAALGVEGVRMKLGDGTLGWKDQAPFDRIIVTAGGPALPHPLVEQLADPGIMVIPVGKKRAQRLLRISKRDGRVTARALGDVAFVDLVGDHGW